MHPNIYEGQDNLTQNPELLTLLLNCFPLPAVWLKPTRQNEEIVDFDYVLVNQAALEHSNNQISLGKKFLSANDETGHKSTLLINLSQVINTGESFQITVNDSVNKTASIHRYSKFEDGILFIIEEISNQQIGANAAQELARHRRIAMKLNEQTSQNSIAEENNSSIQHKTDSHFIAQLAETSPDIIFLLDLNTRDLLYANRMVGLDLGYTKEQIAAMDNPVFDIMYDEDVPAMLEHLKKMKTVPDNTTVEMEYRMVSANGEIKWYCDRNAVYRRDENGIPIQKIGISKDITEAKQKSDQAETLLNILNQAEQMTGMGSWEYDVATSTLKWSPAMYHLFNLPADTLVHPEIYLTYCVEQDRDKVERMVNKIVKEFEPFEESFIMVPPGCNSKIVKVKADVKRDSHNNPVRVTGVDMDVTEQFKSSQRIKGLNEKLINMNRDLESLNRELRTFNKVAANDYKETLQTLYTNLEFIVSREARNLSDTSKANIRRAQSAVQKMKLLTEDINSYLELYEMEVALAPVNTNEILQKVLATQQRKIEQAEVKIDAVELPELRSHPTLMTMLLTQIIDNAVKFRKPDQPTIIRINHTREEALKNLTEAIQDTPYVIISVSDNGIGFTEAETDRIFDLFYRVHDKTKYRGSGIGLSICKKIMAMHNGFIKAEGREGDGTTIRCFFPLN